MAHFQFAVSGQVLDLLSPTRGISDTIDVNSAEFEFRSPEWEGIQKWAHFSNPDYNKGESQDYELIGDEISAERGLNLTPGIWDVYVTGHLVLNGEAVRRYVTEAQSIMIVQSGIEDNSPLGQIEASAAEQIYAKADEAYSDRITTATVTVGENVGTPEASVVITGEPGTRSLDFSFDNILSNGIASIDIDDTPENSGRITVTLDDGTVETYDGIKDTLIDFNEFSDAAEEAETQRQSNEEDRIRAEEGRAEEFATWSDIQYTSEAYAVGTRHGVDVPDTDPAYENNSKYYAEEVAAEYAASAGEYSNAAENAADDAAGSASDALSSAASAASSESNAEAWAVGTRGGDPVVDGDDTYHNNSKYYAEQAGDSATSASASESNAYTSETNASASATAAAASAAIAVDSEAWAVGTRNGTDVPDTDPTYHNNAKFYATVTHAEVSPVICYVDSQDSGMLVFEYWDGE